MTSASPQPFGLLASSLAEWEEAGRPGAVLPPDPKKPPRSVWEIQQAARAREEYAERHDLAPRAATATATAKDEYLDRTARTMIRNIPAQLIHRARGQELRMYCESHGLPRFSVETRTHAKFLLREAERATEAAA